MATCLDLANDAYTLVGVKAAGDTLPPAQASYAQRQINAIVSAWKTQSLTVLSTERLIFPLQDGKQTYFIGPGAEFNVSRPQAIDRATLLLNGLSAPQTASSVTRALTVVTVNLTAHGFSVNDQAFVYGQTCDPDYNGVQVVTSVPTVNSFTYTILGNPPSPATGTMTVSSLTPSIGQNLEIPIAMLTDAQYQSVQLKGLSNSQFTQCYYRPTQPWGTVFLWGRPQSDANQLVIYTSAQFDGFATLARDYTWADVPGYYDALQFALAERLLFAFPGQADAGYIRQQAKESLALVKRQNYRLTDLPSDAARAISGDRRWGYNINSGNG